MPKSINWIKLKTEAFHFQGNTFQSTEWSRRLNFGACWTHLLKTLRAQSSTRHCRCCNRLPEVTSATEVAPGFNCVARRKIPGGIYEIIQISLSIVISNAWHNDRIFLRKWSNSYRKDFLSEFNLFVHTVWRNDGAWLVTWSPQCKDKEASLVLSRKGFALESKRKES